MLNTVGIWHVGVCVYYEKLLICVDLKFSNLGLLETEILRYAALPYAAWIHLCYIHQKALDGNVN